MHSNLFLHILRLANQQQCKILLTQIPAQYLICCIQLMHSAGFEVNCSAGKLENKK